MLSIRSYRLAHPGTDSVPTITQSFGLAGALANINARHLRRLRRRERWRRAGLRIVRAARAVTQFARTALARLRDRRRASSLHATAPE